MKYKKLLVPLFVILLLLPLIVHLIPIISVYANDAWWDDDYAYRKTVWMDTQTISEDLTNFVIMVHIGDEFNWTATQADGDDIRFASGAGVEYDYELARWDDGNDAWVWVKVPTITKNNIAANYVWMYYGNSTVSSGEDPETVWSEYVLVHHIEEASGTIYDQTESDRDGTDEGEFIYQQSGLVGYCGKGSIAVDDAGYRILDQAGTVLDFGTLNMTIEVIVKGMTDLDGDESALIYAIGSISAGGDWRLELEDDSGHAKFWIHDGVNQPTVEGTTDIYTKNTGFTYVVGVRNTVADKLYIYVNGTTEGNIEDTAGSIRDNPDYGFCNSPTGGTRGPGGYYDEVRMSNMSRSAEWVEASNLNYFGLFALWGLEGVDVTILDMEGCGNWIFAQEKYYTFQARISHAVSTDYIDTVKIAFYDGTHWINATYDHVNVEWYLDDGEDVVNIKAGTTSTVASTLIITFPIFLESGILDVLDVDIWLWSSDIVGDEIPWEEKATDYFNIYSQGGLSAMTTSGNAGRVTGGGIYELFAYNNSYVLVNSTFRKLQHYHTMFYIRAPKTDIDEYEGDIVWLEFGIDYCVGASDTWLAGWKVRVDNYESWIDSTRIHCTWKISWYWRNSLIKSDYVQSFFHWNGSVTADGRVGLFVDLWVTRDKASSFVGGRINSEYFGMEDNSNPWVRFITGSDWGPTQTNVTQSMFFHDLEDESNEIISAKELTLMRHWVKLYQGANTHNSSYEMIDYDLQDFKRTFEEMTGVDTPVLVSTKVISMPSTGFLAALGAIFAFVGTSITNAISWGALGLWSVLVLFLDTIGSWIGLPNMFTNFLAYITDMFGYIALGMTNMTTMLTSIFDFFAGPVVDFLSYIGRAITSVTTTLTVMVNIVTGVYPWTVNIFEYFNIDDFITLFFVFGVPTYFLNVFRQEGIGGVWRKVSAIMNVMIYFVNFFIQVITFVVNLIVSVVEAIPVVE